MREKTISYSTHIHKDSLGRKIVYLPIKLSQLTYRHKLGEPVKVIIEGLIPTAKIDHEEQPLPRLENSDRGIIKDIKALITKYKSVRKATYAIEQLEDVLALIDRELK